MAERWQKTRRSAISRLRELLEDLRAGGRPSHLPLPIVRRGCCSRPACDVWLAVGAGALIVLVALALAGSAPAGGRQRPCGTEHGAASATSPMAPGIRTSTARCAKRSRSTSAQSPVSRSRLRRANPRHAAVDGTRSVDTHDAQRGTGGLPAPRSAGDARRQRLGGRSHHGRRARRDRLRRRIDDRAPAGGSRAQGRRAARAWARSPRRCARRSASLARRWRATTCRSRRPRHRRSTR